jgi:hypothetical protein
MPHIAIVPADTAKNISVLEVGESVDLSALLDAPILDHIHFGHAGFDMVVNDLGTLVEAPVNLRADALAKANGRHHEAHPIVGDVAVLGCDPLGDWADVPVDVVVSLA